MLKHTFRHLSGIGPVKEARWWGAGICSWEQLASQAKLKPETSSGIEQSFERLACRDARFFGDSLPSSERWRVYPDFANDTGFLDIETTGLSAGDSVITVVGLLTKSGYTAYVRGDNLDDLPDALSRLKLIVTFNGASFDLPFIAAELGRDVFAHAAHVDMRHVMRRAGYSGGLKQIEWKTGLGRASVLANLGGADAVTLWRMADEGEPGALETLVRYNAEDVASLPRLAALAVSKLAEGTPMAAAPAPAFPAYDCSALPFDRSLIQYLAERRGYRLPA